jgi:conjugal transfer mating pair stabilization protein TraN
VKGRLPTRAIVALLAADLLLVAGTLTASAQTTKSARDDGKAFGTALGAKAQQSAKQAPTAQTVPNYRAGTAPQSRYFSDPDRMAPAAGSAAGSHDGYQTIKRSVQSRARFAPADIEAAIARGQAVADDPLHYTSGMVGGSSGSCRELPASAGSGGTYEATCNSGYALDQATGTCTVRLVVTVRSTTQYRYACSSFNADFNGVDNCILFDAKLGGTCRITGYRPGRCLQGRRERFGQTWCTEPGEPIAQISCSETVPGARIISSSTVRTAIETKDESLCAGLAADAECTAQTETCTDGSPVTRIIDGLAVTKPCWAWSRTYQCNRIRPAEDCGELERNASCSFLRQDCLTEDSPCTTWERVYRCPVPDQPAATRQYICDGDIYCINGECETIDRQPNTEFRDAAVALNAAKQAGLEFDPNNLTLFKGTRETCRKKVFGLLNCCAGKAFPLIPGASLLVSLGCNRSEVLLHQRDAQGLCKYVGSYCSDSVLGVCVTKKKTYCCFESKLSRILQEQGRPQIGKPWASPRREQCLGFTVDEFARLDLSRMDFSEVYAEFQDAARLPEELSTVSDMQRKITEFYAINGPAQ